MVPVGEVKDHPDIMGTTFNKSIDQRDNTSQMGASHSLLQVKNVHIKMVDGEIDESLQEYINFKRQNVTRWGGLSQLI